MKRVLDLNVPPQTVEVSKARASLAALETLVSGYILEKLRLLVTELITNAVRHTGLRDAEDLIGLRIFTSSNTLRVEVEDPGDGFEAPADPRPEPDQASGWGLYLVAKTADRWGVENRARRGSVGGSSEERVNIVWFELDDIRLQDNTR